MKKCVVLLLVLALGYGTSVNAEETVSLEESKMRMEDFVVSAARIEEPRKDQTIGMTVIGAEDIQRSSASDLGELLSEKGGVFIKKYPGSLTSIGIRGFKTESHGNDLKGEVLILIDGRRVGTGNAAKIAVENIERVEIIKGSAAVQYGSAAVGGLVNVITKKGGGNPSFYVEAGGGTYGLLEEKAGFSGKAGRADFSGSITHSTMDDYDTGDGTEYKNSGYDSKLNGSLNLGFEVMPKNRISLIYTVFETDEVGNPSYISSIDFDDYKDSSNYSGDLIYDGRFGDSVFCKVRYFFGEDEDSWHDLTGHDPSGWDDGVPSEKKTESMGSQAQVSFVKDLFSVTGGIDWINYDVEATWTPEETVFDNSAFFLLSKVKLLEKRLILSGGLRYDMYEVEMKKPAGRTEDDTNLTPTAGLAWQLNDNIKFRMNYSEAFVMPEASELAADFESWGVHYVGNPDLGPEKSNTYEAGVDLTYDFLFSSLTYFITDYKDRIVSAVNGNGDSTWINSGEAKVSGLECEVSGFVRNLPLDLELKPYLIFTYLDEYKDEDTNDDIKYISELDLSCGLSLTDMNGFNADLSASYIAEQDITDYEFGTYETLELDSVTLYNFTISKRVFKHDKAGSLTIRGEIRNIADEEIAYVQGFPLPGRTFFASLKYNY